MKRFSIGVVMVVLGIQYFCHKLFAQGTFQNLNFEDAFIPPGTRVGQPLKVFFGLPYWQVEIAGAPQSTMLYNETTVGASSLALLQNDDSGNRAIDGTFSTLFNAAGSGDVTLSQTGFIPVGIHSLLFKADIEGFPSTPGEVHLTLSGIEVPFAPISIEKNYTVYGANISSFAGRSVELSFMAVSHVPVAPTFLLLDSVSLSTQIVPEPAGMSLMFTGLGFVFWNRSRKSNRTQAMKIESHTPYQAPSPIALPVRAPLMAQLRPHHDCTWRTTGIVSNSLPKR